MNKTLLAIKIYLVGIKYNYLYLKRNYLFKPKNVDVVKKFKKKNKIVICGNGPSYKIFEKDFLNGKYKDYDVLMLNYGALETKININFHIFEMPDKTEDTIEYIRKLDKLCSSVCRVFRPRDTDQALEIETCILSNIYTLKEKRIRQNNKSILYEDLKQFSSDNVLFCRSSIVYATLFSLKLGYTEILYVGINPDSNSSWCSNENGNQDYHANRVIQKGDIHPTFRKVAGVNSYDVIKLITKFNLFKNRKFKIESNSYNFLQ